MEQLLAILGNGSIRRWALGGFTTLLIVANGKFNLGLTEFTIGSITALAIATILGSNYKAGQEIIAEAQTAVAESVAKGSPVVKTPAEVAASLAKI